MLLYQFLRFVFLIAIRAFFGRISISGLEYVPRKGALIIAANHPSAFLDPVVVAVWLRRPVYFLTNGGVFTSPFVKWLFRQLFMIPIYRKQDSAEASQKNEQTFAACFELLAKGGALMIFPEGSSKDRRELRPLKTGTARIALGALVHLPPEKDVQIICVGINYTNPRQFQSLLKLNYAPPISARAFLAQPDNIQALTCAIAATLSSMIVVTPDCAADKLTRQIEEVYGYQLKKELFLDLPYTDSVFMTARQIANGVSYFLQTTPEKVTELQQLLTDYLSQLKQRKISDRIFNTLPDNPALWHKWIVAIVGFPLYLYSELHNYIPYRLPGLLAVRLTHEAVYRAPINLLLGIFTFGLLYPLYTYIFTALVSNSQQHVLLYLISLPISGYFAFHYYRFVHSLRQKQRVWRLRKYDAVQWEALHQQRRRIVDLLETARSIQANMNQSQKI